MYSNKINVNILTSLLAEHGVRHIVVCPGSRNAPLVHNFSQCDAFFCHPVTDERSAGFVALGLRQQSREPVAVCVTSGSALLNVLPAVAEATYQHQGIIVISADRPAAWVDQMDGQTLPQPGALGTFVAVSVSLPEVAASHVAASHEVAASQVGALAADKTASWHCNRLVNEAILANKAPGHPSVHINVPLSEPLFEFTVDSLPRERMVESGSWSDLCIRQTVLESYAKARRPMVVMGQLPSDAALTGEDITRLLEKAVVLWEPISMEGMPASYTDQMLAALPSDSEEYSPDWVLYVGGHTVSKRLRKFLRSLGPDTMQILVSEDGRLRDISQNTRLLIHSSAFDVLHGFVLDDVAKTGTVGNVPGDERAGVRSAFIGLWRALRRKVADNQEAFEPAYSQLMAVRCFEEKARARGGQFFYANSMSVRLAALFADGYCFCNRGLNGIEGSLSVAAGASLADPDKRVYCVIGDLSFFYDQNALWQTLGGNFRILLLNNCQGGIFKILPGLSASPVSDSYVAGGHKTKAQGACQEYGISYRCVVDEPGLMDGIEWLVNSDSTAPMLLEVCTDAEVDAAEFRRLYKAAAL